MNEYIELILICALTGGALNILTPKSAGGLWRYVRYICALVLFLLIVSPLIKLFFFAENAELKGINSDFSNIYEAEENKEFLNEMIENESLSLLEEAVRREVDDFGSFEYKVVVETPLSELKKITLIAYEASFPKERIKTQLEKVLGVEVQINIVDEKNEHERLY